MAHNGEPSTTDDGNRSDPTATAAEVGDAIVGEATTGKVTDPGTGSPNRLLYNGFISLGASITIVQESVAKSPQDFTYSATCPSGPCAVFFLYDVYDVCDTGETVSLANRRVTIDLVENKQVTCTFTNRSPSITIVQDRVPDAPHAFAFTSCLGAGCGQFSLGDDGPGGLPSSVPQSSITLFAAGGTTYRLAVDGFNGATGNVSLAWSIV